MKASRGKANPQQVNEALRKQLGLTSMNEVQRFVLEDSGIRGALVRLEETWQQVIAAHDYPPARAHAARRRRRRDVLLASGLKTTPSVSLQLQGEGPLKLLVDPMRRRLNACAAWRTAQSGPASACRCSAKAGSS